MLCSYSYLCASPPLLFTFLFQQEQALGNERDRGNLECVGECAGQELEKREVALAHEGVFGAAALQDVWQQSIQILATQHCQHLRKALCRPTALHAGSLLGRVL